MREEQRLVEDALRLLEKLARDRSRLADLTSEQRDRLMQCAHRIALPDRSERRRLLRSLRRREEEERTRAAKEHDQALLDTTGIRASARRYKRAEPPQPLLNDGLESKAPSEQTPHADDGASPRDLHEARTCYVCKARFTRVHHFYDSLCSPCAELNWERRHQSVDLEGRVALVTGGRVKIGFHAALKLLRAGAQVVVTTRFPRDAARRFAMESDASDWRDRLEIRGIDLRSTPDVELLCRELLERLPRLDFLLNNACQTVRRPPGFYAHLMEGERTLKALLPGETLSWLRGHEESAARTAHENGRSAELTQLALTAEDRVCGPQLFPEGALDEDLQQVDLRTVNSWRLRLHEVSTVELLEVQLVNSVAPYVLNARLKPLMLRTATRDKHIVNVSAMEGVFYRAYKTDKHPHTNMAKAALNMMTRTAAQDFARDGIHMNSVDTGWITDEDPEQIKERKREELGFHPPLDQIDAAARICDPIFQGFLTGRHAWGHFYKDYQIANW